MRHMGSRRMDPLPSVSSRLAGEDGERAAVRAASKAQTLSSRNSRSQGLITRMKVSNSACLIAR